MSSASGVVTLRHDCNNLNWRTSERGGLNLYHIFVSQRRSIPDIGMTTEAEHNLAVIQHSLSDLRISPSVAAQEPDTNPWQDSATDAPSHDPIQPIKLPDVSHLDPTTSQGLAAELVTEPTPLKPQ